MIPKIAPVHAVPLEERIDQLIRGPQYALPQAEKEQALLEVLRELCPAVGQQCPPYGRFLDKLGLPPDQWRSLADIPPLPVSVFKRFTLSAVPPQQVVRQLLSSTTTGQQPSRILIDKTTAFRQTRALAAILKEHIGPQRRPFLVLDAKQTVADGEELTARGAAIRGIGSFASETVFALRQSTRGDLEPDFEAIQQFAADHGAGEMLLFGFTFIVWTRLVEEAERRGVLLKLPQATLLHAGGWKRLQDRAVAKEDFTRRTAAVLGCAKDRILDFYGMVEQVGTVFVDCPQGHKHAPAFADVLLRRPGSMKPVEPGESGIIEVLSVLPTSYPGQALLTEDQGRLIGVDDCPCGRRGVYFQFTQRIERAPVRGCGDTFAHAEVRR